MKLLQKLVQIQSISGNEAEIAKFILDTLQGWGVGARRQNGNVISYIPGRDGSRALIFNAHMDTVPASNPKKWKYPPYGKRAGKIVGDRLYGLGASDDKGAVAAILIIANLFSARRKNFLDPQLAHDKTFSVDTVQVTRSPCDLRKFSPASQNFLIPPIDLWFTFVCGEETDGSGTEKFLDWFCDTKYFKKYKKIPAIIGEPTDCKELEIGHRGNIFLTVTAKGLSGHGGKNYKSGDLSINKIMRIACKLEYAAESWKRKYRDKFLGESSLNITSIFSSTNIANVVPGECSLCADIRTTPALHGKIKQLLKDLIGQTEGISLKIRDRSPGFTSPQAEVVKSFQRILPGIKMTSSMGTTDLSQFTAKGIETVVFGPGDKDCIHKENEFTELSNVSECAKIYRKIIENL